MNFPVMFDLSKSNQEYLFTEPVTEFTITSNDWDFSRTPIISPGFKVNEAMLTTPPFTVICAWETNFSKFINQRVRWASKNKHIKSLVNTFTGLIILLANFSWPILGVLSIFYPQLAQYFLITTLLKCIIDFLLLFLASRYYKKSIFWWWLLPVWIGYSFFVLSVWILSWFYKPKWK